MITFTIDWFVFMFLFQVCGYLGKQAGIDVDIPSQIITASSFVIIFRLSKIYDLLKQRQGCKKD